VRYRRSARTLSRRVGDEVLIARPGGGDVLSLSGTGSAIWNLLGHPSTTSELADEMAQMYESASEEIANDIDKFVHALIAKNLVQRDV
jgi:hypothetical protein